jgi:outer membrane protein
MIKAAGALCVTAILAVLLASPAGAPAQNVQDQGPLALTLEDCIALALSQNPFHLAAGEREGQARAQLQEARARFFPSLSAQGTNTLSEKNFILEFPSLIPGEPPQEIEFDFTRDYQAAMSFSLPLFAGGRIRSGYRQADFNLKAVREGVRQSEQDTVFGVKQAFYSYLLAGKFAEVAEESLTLAENHRKNVQSLYDVGMSSKFDLLRAEVQVANLKPQLIKARNSLHVAELGLKTVLGVDLDRPVRVVGDLDLVPQDFDVEALVEAALAERPELRQIDFQRRMAGEMLKVARSAYWPSIAVAGTYNFWGDRMTFRKGAWQDYYSVNLVLSWSIFNGFESQARSAQAKAAIRELDWTEKGMAETVEFEVRQAVLNYQQATESLLSQEKNVEQALEAVRIAELNYGEGLATSLDVTTARVALSQARTNHAQALYDCVLSQAQLERAVGRSRANERKES